jgi:NAD+ kinase
MIVHDPRNPGAEAIHRELTARLPDGVDDVLLVIGGDGFMLRTVSRYGFDHTYLGLNAGRIGFLLNDVDDWDRVAVALVERNWTAHTFPTLQAEVTTRSGEKVVDQAVNDVYLERGTGQTAHLELLIDGHEVVDRLVADGIVFSTALGSTAYTFSAGGPACHPAVRAMLVTPICPHTPRLHPFALPNGSRVSVSVLSPERRPVRAVVDGREIEDAASVEVSYGTAELSLAFLPGDDFTSRMVRKILRA